MVIREYGEVVRDGDQSIGARGTRFREVRVDLRAVEACLANLRLQRCHPLLPVCAFDLDSAVRSAPFLPVGPASVHAFSLRFFPSGAPCACSRLLASSGTCSMQARRIETARFSFDPSDSAGNSAALWPLGSSPLSFVALRVFTATASAVDSASVPELLHWSGRGVHRRPPTDSAFGDARRRDWPREAYSAPGYSAGTSVWSE